MTTEEKIARRKLNLLDLVRELRNVSRACKGPHPKSGRTETQELALRGVTVSSGGVRGAA